MRGGSAGGKLSPASSLRENSENCRKGSRNSTVNREPAVCTELQRRDREAGFAGNGSGNAEESVLRLLAESICGGRRTFFEDAETLRKKERAPYERLLRVGVENVEIDRRRV